MFHSADHVVELADLSTTLSLGSNLVFSLLSISSEPYFAIRTSSPQTLAHVNMKWAILPLPLLLLLLAAVAQAGRMPVCAVSPRFRVTIEIRS
jgi:hypothetical protein